MRAIVAEISVLLNPSVPVTEQLSALPPSQLSAMLVPLRTEVEGEILFAVIVILLWSIHAPYTYELFAAPRTPFEQVRTAGPYSLHVCPVGATDCE